MKNIAFIESWNATPHFETSLELAKLHLENGDKVHYYFIGNDLIITPEVNFIRGKNGYKNRLPELVGSQLLKSDNFLFHKTCKLPKHDVTNQFGITNIDELKNLKYKNFDIGKSVLNFIVDEIKDVDPDILSYELKIQHLINDAISCYEFSLENLFSQNIDIIYIFNGRFINNAAIAAAAKALNIEIFFHERGSSKDKYFLEKFIPHNLNEMQSAIRSLWSEAYKFSPSDAIKVASDFYINNRTGIEKSWLSYTKLQKKDMLPKITAGKKVITYFSTCDDEYSILEGWDWDSYEWNDQYSAVLALIELCQADNSIELFIRLHPNLANKSKRQQEQWASLSNIKGVNVIPPNSEIDTYRLIELSDLVAVTCTTVGIESIYWRTPVISLGPSYYCDLGATYIAKTKSDLKKLLESDNLIANTESALPYGYFFSTFGIDFKYYKADDLFHGTFLGVDLTKQEIKNLVIVFLDHVDDLVTWENFEKNVIIPLNADLAVLSLNTEPSQSDNLFWKKSKYKWDASFTTNYFKIDTENIQDDRFAREFLLKIIEVDKLDDIYGRFILTSPSYFWVGPHPPTKLLEANDIWVHGSEEGLMNQHAIINREALTEYLLSTSKLSEMGIVNKFPCIMYATKINNIANCSWQDTQGEHQIPAPHNLIEFYTAMSNFSVINTQNSWMSMFDKLNPRGGFSPYFLLMDRHFNTLDVNLNIKKDHKLNYYDPEYKIIHETHTNSCLMIRFSNTDAILFDSVDESQKAIYKINKFNTLSNASIWEIRGGDIKNIGLNSLGYFTNDTNEIVAPPLIIDLLTLCPIIPEMPPPKFLGVA